MLEIREMIGSYHEGMEIEAKDVSESYQHKQQCTRVHFLAETHGL